MEKYFLPIRYITPQTITRKRVKSVINPPVSKISKQTSDALKSSYGIITIPRLNRNSAQCQFFGVDSAENIQAKLENHMALSWLKRKDYGIVEFPPLNTDTKEQTILNSKRNIEKCFKELDVKKLGRLTISADFFGKNEHQGTHTVGLFKNQDKVFVIDSLMRETGANSAVINDGITRYRTNLKEVLGSDRVIFITKPQQRLDEYTCNNWTHANLDALSKTDKDKAYSKVEILNLLPDNINEILKEQQKYIESKLKGRSLFDVVAEEKS